MQGLGAGNSKERLAFKNSLIFYANFRIIRFETTPYPTLKHGCRTRVNVCKQEMNDYNDETCIDGCLFLKLTLHE